MIQGKDTGKCIILGAHYDHLGKRNDDIFYGADDNASGTAGLLALAKMWKISMTRPACNILFTAWTAEEKGLLGSRYFASMLPPESQNILLYLNMDMISRSESDDSLQNRLSIGIRENDRNLQDLAKVQNVSLEYPFELDIWDVTGRSGSDYGSFLGLNTPVMTFNAGLHNDYHTPADVVAKADLKKMEKVLKLVHNCLLYFLNNIETQRM
jgi:Zn-dependent M28 family amino/carboxypeptidase